jgi:hypothetical protein
MSQPRELFFQQPEHMPRRAHIFQMKNPFVFMHGKSGEGKFLLREDAVPGLVAEFLSGRKLCCIEDTEVSILSNYSGNFFLYFGFAPLSNGQYSGSQHYFFEDT